MNASPQQTQDPFSISLAGRRLGRYQVLARLASGGMAGVYVSRALGVAGFERLFAIKVLHPHLAHEQEFVSMFLDEARLAARIRHPNVVPTIDISDSHDAGYFLVMDYIEGDHLGALLQTAFKQGTKIPIEVALRIIVDALDGLAAAHNLTDERGDPINLVHRDVSPHNIMVGADGISRLTDFGVAKTDLRLSTTSEGQFKGKLAYMAPEHASSGETDKRSDLFSMAIILWECVTGTRLFRADNQAATLNRICLEPIPMPSSVDPSLAPFDAILERGLARDPEQRYQNAEEFADALEQAAPTLGGLAHQRVVAKLVREYAAEKLENDKQLIRDAVTAVAASEPPAAVALPELEVQQSELGETAEPAAAAMPLPVSSVPPAGATPAYSAAPPAAPSAWQRGLIMGVGVVVAVAAGLGLALLYSEEPVGEVMISPLESEVAEEPETAEDPEAQPAVEATAAAPEATADGTEQAKAAVEPDDKPRLEPKTERKRRPRQSDRKTTRASTTRPKKARTGDRKPVASTPEKPKPAKKPAKKLGDDLMLNPYR